MNAVAAKRDYRNRRLDVGDLIVTIGRDPGNRNRPARVKLGVPGSWQLVSMFPGLEDGSSGVVLVLEERKVDE